MSYQSVNPFSGNILDCYAKNAASFLAPEKLKPSHGEAHM